MSFLQKLKIRIQQFMYGRYGADQLSRAVSVLSLVLIGVQFIVSLFGLSVVSYVIWAIVWVLLVWNVFRMFSKKIAKRYAENQKYLFYQNKYKSFIKLQKDRWRDRKTHIYRHCPHCKCVLRLPRKKGKHTVRCPKCGQERSVRSF